MMGTGFLIFLQLISWSSLSDKNALRVVKQLDPIRYAGSWYEIATTEGLMGADCACMRSRVEHEGGSWIMMFNTCNDRTPRGPKRRQTRVAVNLNKDKQGLFWQRPQLSLKFSQYRVVSLGPNYEYAVLSDAEGRNLSILSRAPEMPINLMYEILIDLYARGVDTDRILPTWQHDCNYPY